MVYFIFEALYCRFFFFFHFNEALIALRLEITFVLLSSSFPPFLLLIRFFFFLSPVIVPPPPLNDITCCSFLLPTISFFLFAFDFSLLSFQVWMQRSPSFISIVRNVSRRCVLGVLSHFSPLSPLSFPFTRSSYPDLAYPINSVLERSISQFRHATR